jgi:CheY-like chemotaxis protein
LFRGAQEALTNITRYAPGATTSVTVSYQADCTLVSIEDHVCSAGADPGTALAPRSGLLAGAGGGYGLTAMRERAHRVGGTARAGPDAPGPGPIRVLIADDQRVVRDGLTMLVRLIDGVQVVDTACDGAEAVRLAEDHRPGVVLMDLRMPGTDGIATAADLRQRLPATQVLVLTTYADGDAIVPALQAGARGYLTKDASAEQIEAAIYAVRAGRPISTPPCRNAW